MNTGKTRAGAIPEEIGLAVAIDVQRQRAVPFISHVAREPVRLSVGLAVFHVLNGPSRARQIHARVTGARPVPQEVRLAVPIDIQRQGSIPRIHHVSAETVLLPVRGGIRNVAYAPVSVGKINAGVTGTRPVRQEISL